MDKNMFIKRLVELRMQKGVSARDMSLTLGQSPSYINNIENGINLPSMTVFFYICDYFGITPKEFFDVELKNPSKSQELMRLSKNLSGDQLDLVMDIVRNLK
ncbi:MAG: helix-turn-helix transcriptional regulator [Clostridia bacterium]|nr:helix-turn-helix transcriptional regulator [Clostridia bacterium]